MSNKRRKKIGSTKIKANRLRRVVRGATKHGWPLPGEGRWLADYDERVPATTRVAQNREDVRELVAPYWGTP